MKFVIVFAALFAVALAAPAQPQDVQILRSDSVVLPDGFSWGFETSDGQSASEQGTLKNQGTEQEAISVTGQFQYVGLDGVTYAVKYVADENGFQPSGAHLPVA